MSSARAGYNTCTCTWERIYTDESETPLVERIVCWDITCPAHRKAKILTFKNGGKYYTELWWIIPKYAIGPYDMANSEEYQLWRAAHPTWHALVVAQEPWGHPFLLAGTP